MSRLQPLRDARFIPAALREALGFVYSRHVRNQSTIGGEIAARRERVGAASRPVGTGC